MKAAKTLLFAATAAIALASCTNTAGEIGGDLVTDETEVVVEDSFDVKGHSTESNVPVQSRTTTQILGAINAEGFGNFTSEVVTQFMPATEIDTDEITTENIDSIRLVMIIPRSGGWVGDSIAPMGLQVYRLNRQLPQPIFSDFDPTGYYDPSTGLLGETIYSVNTLEKSDSIKNLSYREIAVKLNTDLAFELYNLYKTNPAAYSTPHAFAEHFPGIAIVNSYGAGRLIKATSTTMRLYYHTTETDDEGETTTTVHEGTFWAVAPEIVTNNCFRYDMAPDLLTRIDQGDNIICAPAGRDVEIEFPARDVINYYFEKSGSLSVINTVTFSIPAETVTNDYGITPPPSILLVLAKDRDKFFAENKITDDKTSFYASYDESTHSYRFTGMRPYILDLIDRYGRQGTIPADEYTFSAVPVTIETEQVSSYGSTQVYVSSVTPYVLTPVMANLNLEKAVVTLTFSKQTVR